MAYNTCNVSTNNNPEWFPLGQECVNNISNSYSKVPVLSHAYVDSGSSVHCDGENMRITDKVTTLHGICVRKPDATTMRLTHVVNLPTPQLYLVTYRVHILPEMKDRCIISVGQLWDNLFVVNFDNRHLLLQKEKLLLTGNRDPVTGLYLINFDAPQPLSSASHF